LPAQKSRRGDAFRRDPERVAVRRRGGLTQ
jgi:hypothetical protein